MHDVVNLAQCSYSCIVIKAWRSHLVYTTMIQQAMCIVSSFGVTCDYSKQALLILNMHRSSDGEQYEEERKEFPGSVT